MDDETQSGAVVTGLLAFSSVLPIQPSCSRTKIKGVLVGTVN